MDGAATNCQATGRGSRRLLSRGGGETSEPRYHVEHIVPDETTEEWPVSGPRDSFEEGPNDALIADALKVYNEARRLPDAASKRAALEQTLPWLADEQFLQQRNDVLLEIAKFDQMLGEHELARQRIQQVIDTAKEPSWRPHFYLAVGEYMQGRLDEALAGLEKGAELGALTFKDGHDGGAVKWTETLQLRAEIFFQRGQDDEALVELSKLLLEEPREIDALELRARIYLKKRGAFDAVRDYGLILVEEPNHAGALVGRAFGYLQLARRDIAKKELQRAHYLDQRATCEAILQLSVYAPATPAMSAFVDQRADIERNNASFADVYDQHSAKFAALFDQLIAEP